MEDLKVQAKIGNLFASAYTRKVLHEKGSHLKESLHRKEHCYYQGQIRNKPSSHAAISSCNGFRGYVSDGEETYHIQPINGTTHRIFRNADRKKLPFKCGTERHDVFHPLAHLLPKHSRKKRAIHGPYDANKFTRFVELYIVNDYRTFDRHGKNADAVFKRTQDIANIVNSLYRQLNIYIVLVGVEVWSTGDKISITRSADTSMENFLRYRKERINPYHTNDNAQLITGILFDHGVVGKAIKGPICTHQFSGGVSMDYDGLVTLDYDGLVTLVATTMAHEMGHNFGTTPHHTTPHHTTPHHTTPHNNDKLRLQDYDWLVTLDYDGLVTLVATTMAHEMGHNFGMEHDNDSKCSCPQDKCIMAATSGQFSPQHWSSCSQNALHEAFELGMDYCLRNPPATIFDGPVCGNGLVEEGEECDCGLEEDCTNRCCNASACMLHSQAECGTGRCCDLSTCKPKKPATLCREPIGECDLSEYCDGASEYCPPDVHIQDGLACADDKSYCYKGKCNTHSGQCQLLWGNTGRVSDPICFQQLNTRGNHDGNCGYNWTTDRYKTCERENVMCGLLHCVHLNEKLMFWRDNLALDMRANFLTRGNTQYVCRSTMLDVGLDMADPGLVPDGARCENNKICIKQTCTPLMKLKTLKCPDCNNNGVCNSKGNCHCHVGYAPPLCDRPGYGGSLDSGPATNEYAKRDLLIGLLVLFLVVVPLITLAFLAYINRKRLRACWKLGPRVKFGALKKNSSAPPPPQPWLSSSFSDKRWSSAPSKPSTTLEISGPLLEDPPNYDEYCEERAAVRSGTSRPIFKPSANKASVIAPKQKPPISQHGLSAAPVSAVPAVAIAGGEGRRNMVSPSPAADGAPTGVTAAETNKPSRLLLLNNFSDSTLKRLQKRKEEVKTVDLPAQDAPTSPTKGGKEIVKRTSFRGTEISSPILVSTTNRDSQVFADLELDQAGVNARPVGRQHSIHGSHPVSEGVADGSRNPVRRNQSDRPVSSNRPTVISHTGKKTPSHPTSSLASRPLPPEPVDEDEPLYANEGLSNLDDLKAQISSAFEGFSFSPPEDSDKSTDFKPKDTVGSAPKTASKPVFNNVLNKDTRKTSTPPVSSTTKKISSKPEQPSNVGLIKPSSFSENTASKFAPRSDDVSSKPQSFSGKSTALERVLNNPVKNPFALSSEMKPTPSLSSTVSSKGPDKASSTPGNPSTAGKPAGTGSSDGLGRQPSTAADASSRPTVRGPFGNAMLKGSSVLDSVAKESTITPASKSSLASKGLLSALVKADVKTSEDTPATKLPATTTASKGLLSNKAALSTAASSAGDTKTSTVAPASKPSAIVAAQKELLSGKGPLSSLSSSGSDSRMSNNNNPENKAAVQKKPQSGGKGLLSTVTSSSSDNKTSNVNPASKSSATTASQRGPLAGKEPLSTTLKSSADSNKSSGQTPASKLSAAATSTNKGPQSTVANKTPSSLNKASKTPSTLNTASKTPSTLNTASKTSSTLNAASKTPSAINTASKGPTTNKGPSSSVKSSAISKPSSKVSASSALSGKGTDATSTTAKASASNSSTTRGLTTAPTPKVSSAATSARGQNASNITRSGSGANRPALAPKPGGAKTVRSFNF
ncbi:hypothetical protein ACOMHN_021754 [Nucella lapillus]